MLHVLDFPVLEQRFLQHLPVHAGFVEEQDQLHQPAELGPQLPLVDQFDAVVLHGESVQHPHIQYVLHFFTHVMTLPFNLTCRQSSQTLHHILVIDTGQEGCVLGDFPLFI